MSNTDSSGQSEPISDEDLASLIYLADDHIPFISFIGELTKEAPFSERHRKHFEVCSECRRRFEHLELPDLATIDVLNSGEHSGAAENTPMQNDGLSISKESHQNFGKWRIATAALLFVAIGIALMNAWPRSEQMTLRCTSVGSEIQGGGQPNQKLTVNGKDSGYCYFLTFFDGNVELLESPLILDQGNVRIESREFPAVWCVWTPETIDENLFQSALTESVLSEKSLAGELKDFLRSKLELDEFEIVRVIPDKSD